MRDEPCVRELAVHAVYGEAISLPATALNAVQMVRIERKYHAGAGLLQGILLVAQGPCRTNDFGANDDSSELVRIIL
jgi:hypothetical protein